MDEIYCPWCKDHYDPNMVQLQSGNHQVTCDSCLKDFGYHVELEIDDIHKIESDEEE